MVVAVAGGGVWIVYKRRRNSGKGEDKAVRQDKEQLPDASDVKVEKMVGYGTVNSMYLFGDFSVFDRNGRNISRYVFQVSSRYSVSFCVIAMPTEFLQTTERFDMAGQAKKIK